MTITFIVILIVVIVLIFLSGWFSGMETALTNLDSAEIADMRAKNEKHVKYVIRLRRNLDRSIITLLFGNNVVNIVLSAMVALIANEVFHTIGVSIAIGVVTLVVIIFGEITPKSRSLLDSRKIALKNARTLYFLTIFLSPLITVFISIANLFLRVVSDKKPKHLVVSDQDIKDMATLGEQEGSIKGIERDIIHKLFKFGDLKIKDIIVPIKQVFYLDHDIDVEQAKVMITKRGFTRVPVVKDKKIIGLIYSKDILGQREGQLKDYLREPRIVSDNSDITDVFSQMKNQRIHVAVVENKEKKQVGIVTLEDIIEELVGEIHDEYHDRKYFK
ncbi:MAG: hemolysin family protein [bacterium]